MKKIILILAFLVFIFAHNGASANKNVCPWIEAEGRFWNTVCLYVNHSCLWWTTIDTGENNFVNYFDKESQLTRSKAVYKSPEFYFKDSKWYALSPIREIEIVYKENMADIYSCAMNTVSKASKDFEKVFLENEKVPVVKTTINRWLDWIPDYDQNDNCRKIEKEDYNNLQQILLKESTYEICKYTAYMNALDDVFYEDYRLSFLENLENDTEVNEEQETRITESIRLTREQITELIKERKEINFEIHSLSYLRFNDFFNNLTLHMAMEWLRIRVDIYREYLYKTLWPLNQLPWKIINAMKQP